MSDFDDKLSKWAFRALIGFSFFLGAAIVYLIIIVLIALTRTMSFY